MALRDFSDQAMKKFDRQLREANDVSVAKTDCPECDETIEIEDPERGQNVECEDCGAEFEVVSTSPLELELVDEDDDEEDEY